MVGKVLGGTAILGLLAGGWRYVKMAWNRLRSIFFVTIELKSGCMAHYVWPTYVWWSGRVKVSRLVKSIYSASNQFLRPIDDYRTIVYEDVTREPCLAWIGRIPVLLMAQDDPDKNGHGGDTVSLTFLRGTLGKEELLLEMAAFYDEWCAAKDDNGSSRFRVINMEGSVQKDSSKDGPDPGDAMLPESSEGARPVKWKPSDIGPRKVAGALQKLALSPEAEEAVAEAQKWVKSRDWFVERNVPYKRGWLLHGPPGTGKTCFVRAMAQDLDIPVLALELVTFTNYDMRYAWRRAQEKSPCIVLIEDIDTVFDGRKNIAVEDKMTQGVSFGTLLNCIDGVEEADGIFLVLTTNNPDNLDPALGGTDGRGVATRPGRVDRVIEMKELGEGGRRKLALRILKGYEEHVEDIVTDGEGDTGAQFQERCRNLAYHLWERDHVSEEKVDVQSGCPS